MLQYIYISIFILLFGCSSNQENKNRFEQILIGVDEIEFRDSVRSEKFGGKERLEFLRSTLSQDEFQEHTITDEQDFLLKVFLYSQGKEVAQIGIDTGQTHLHYKVNEVFIGKAQMNYRLGMFIQDRGF